MDKVNKTTKAEQTAIQNRVNIVVARWHEEARILRIERQNVARAAAARFAQQIVAAQNERDLQERRAILAEHQRRQAESHREFELEDESEKENRRPETNRNGV